MSCCLAPPSTSCLAWTGNSRVSLGGLGRVGQGSLGSGCVVLNKLAASRLDEIRMVLGRPYNWRSHLRSYPFSLAHHPAQNAL